MRHKTKFKNDSVNDYLTVNGVKEEAKVFLFSAAEILSHASLIFPGRAELFDLKSALKMLVPKAD